MGLSRRRSTHPNSTSVCVEISYYMWSLTTLNAFTVCFCSKHDWWKHVIWNFRPTAMAVWMFVLVFCGHWMNESTLFVLHSSQSSSLAPQTTDLIMNPVEKFDWCLEIVRRLFRDYLYSSIFDKDVHFTTKFIAIQICLIGGIFGYFWMIVDGDGTDILMAISFFMSYIHVSWLSIYISRNGKILSFSLPDYNSLPFRSGFTFVCRCYRIFIGPIWQTFID